MKPMLLRDITCEMVAAVSPQAPASICRRRSCSDMVVFACGARSTPASVHQFAIAEMFFANACSSMVMTGRVKAFPGKRSPTNVSRLFEPCNGQTIPFSGGPTTSRALLLLVRGSLVNACPYVSAGKRSILKRRDTKT